MTHQSFLLIVLVTFFATTFSGVSLDRFFPYGTTHGDTEMERGDDTGSSAKRTHRHVEDHENWRMFCINVSNSVKVPPMCPPLNHPKNGICVTFHFFEGAEARCHCFPGFEFPKSNNGDEIKNKSVRILRCQSTDAESFDKSDNVKSVSWIPEKVADCEPTKPEEECEGADYDTNAFLNSDIVVVPTQMSMTDEYGFNGNNTFHFYCAARGKKAEVFFTRNDDQCSHTCDRRLGNATEEDMTRSEIEHIFDKEFVSSSKCISAKRLTIPFINAESAGLYRCFAGKPYITHSRIYEWWGQVQSYAYYRKEIRLKLERSGGMCHNGSEYPCADGRQCISINQACDSYSNKDCEDGSDEGNLYGCSMPDIVDMTPEEEHLDIPEGGSVNFTCRAVGIRKLFPDPYIIWRVGGNDLDCEILNCHQELENGTSILTLKNIKRANDGEYYCIAAANHTHRSTTRSKHWNVHVVDKQPGDMAANPEEECEEKSLLRADVVVVPKQTSITDEYGFHEGNNTVHFYCAARGKDTQVFFSRNGRKSKKRLLGNATEEDMTFSEIEQIFDRSFVNSSKCITAKRLTIPFTNAESAGSYSCYAKNSYSWTPSTVVHNTVRLKLERSGGTCHSDSEISCADGRQCISKNQVCAGGRHCEDGSDVCGCVVPIFVDLKPDEVLLKIPESDSFNLTCRAVAFLVPSIKWRVNGTEINCTAPDCQQVSEDGTGTLTLENVQRENEGTYTCVAFDDYKVEIISKKEWIVKVVDRKPKEIPPKDADAVEGSVTKLRICV